MSAGQDYKRTIPAGQSSRINANGETFIFMKFADRPIEVDIAGRKVVMRAGSYQEFEPLASENSNIVLYNTDPDNPAFVEIVTGTGTYDEKIVKGEISVIPGVRSASGQFIEDTRWTLKADVDFTDLEKETFTKYEIKEQYDNGGVTSVQFTTYLPRSNEAFYTDNNVNHRRINLKTLEREYIEDLTGDKSGTIEVNGKGYEYLHMNGQPDKNGDIWIGGRAAGGTKAVLVKIDRLFTPLEAYEAPIDMIANISRFNHTAISGDRIFHLISDSNESFIIYELVNGQHIERKRYELNKDYTDPVTKNCYAMLGHIVIGQNSGGPQAIIRISDFEIVPNDQNFPNCNRGISVWEPNREFLSGTLVASLHLKNVLTWTKTAEGTFETCSGGYVFDPQKHITEAGITATQTEQGVKIQGQVIRALLELWLGQFVADDYLDHVYRVEFDNANGRSPITVSSGGTSLAGAKIADSFSCVFPQTVKITLDNNLTTKA